MNLSVTTQRKGQIVLSVLLNATNVKFVQDVPLVSINETCVKLSRLLVNLDSCISSPNLEKDVTLRKH